jgi:hypothetical protein
MDFTPLARRLGVVSAVATVVLVLAYAITLVIGLATLPTPSAPIGNPEFTILEVLIIVMMPVIVVLMTAVHAWAPPDRKVLTLLALVFMALLAVVTCGLHFVVLTLSHKAAFQGQPWSLVLVFKWPSVVYALDILAWDVFFPLSMLFAAPAFRGRGLAAWTRGLMIASGVLALAGLSGVALNNMAYRNIGIVGYVPVFMAVAALLGVLFHRADSVIVSPTQSGLQPAMETRKPALLKD